MTKSRCTLAHNLLMEMKVEHVSPLKRTSVAPVHLVNYSWKERHNRLLQATGTSQCLDMRVSALVVRWLGGCHSFVNSSWVVDLPVNNLLIVLVDSVMPIVDVLAFAFCL